MSAVEIMVRCPQCKAEVAYPCFDDDGVLPPGDYHAERTRLAKKKLGRKADRFPGDGLNVPCPDCGAGAAEYCRLPSWTWENHDEKTHQPFDSYCAGRMRLYDERCRPRPAAKRRWLRAPTPRVMLLLGTGAIFTLLLGLFWRVVKLRSTVAELDRQVQTTSQSIDMLREDIADLHVEINAIDDPDGGWRTDAW